MGPAGKRSRVLIVGGGLAGAKVAESLRAWGFDGRVTIACEEQHRPYERPALSKSYLRGRSGFEDAAVHPEEFYAAHDVELMIGTRVVSVDAVRRTAVVEPGGLHAWDHLVLAGGARPRRLAVEGADLDGVFYLRTVDDADAIRSAAGPGKRVVVIGAGWVGTEAAASLRRTGSEVAMVYRSSTPFESSLGAEIGSVFASLHRSHGVELHPDSAPVRIIGSRGVEGVALDDGTVLEADLVVVGIGVVPAAETAEAAGIAVDDGVLTDGRLRASAPDVYAVGDVAAVSHPLFRGRVRARHWWTALTGPPTVAANIVGVPAVYDWVPTFTSKQYDLMLEHTGEARASDPVVFRGRPGEGPFAAFWMSDGRAVAGFTAGLAGLAHHIRDLVAARAPVDAAVLADPGTDLGALVSGAATT